jgi:hypothetical protein
MTHPLACFRPALAVLGVLFAACTDAPGTDTETTTTADTSTDDGGSSSSVTVGTGTDGTDSSGSSGSPDSSSTDDDGSSDSTGALDACATPGWGAEPVFEKPPGRFTLYVIPNYRWLTGFITDGPRLEFHEESEREGPCRLLTYTPSNCEPGCTAPEVCIAGACVSEPLGVSAGVVTLTGVGDEPIELAQDPLHTYYWETMGELPLTMPSLSATGAEVGAFELATCPTTAPTPTDDWSALLEARAPGESVTLTWSDPIDTARVYLRMTTGIGTHGGISPVEIECEGPDVGTLELPGAYLDALYAEGWSCGECGGNDLVRYHVDETDAGGTTVQLRTQAATGFWFIP